MTAVGTAASVSAGRMRCARTSRTPPSPRGEIMPLPGSTPSTSENTMMKTMPSQNDGVLMLISASTMEARSIQPPRLIAASTPTVIPTTALMRRLAPASSAVAWNRSTISMRTGRWDAIDRPRSPCSTWPSQVTYWMGSGRSRPSSSRRRARSSGRTSGPRRSCAGSPGARCSARNRTMDTPNSTPTRPNMRCRM